ncbi:MAG: hypothetical protein CL464_07805 [Acidimicrobiaceae bacterium]|nr:hypothetical protein [Acidimicrobiaceae bacterium]
MTAAITRDLPVTPDAIEIWDGSRFLLSKSRRSLGNQLVGATTLFGLATLMVLLGHAVFYSMINSQHVELDRLENVIVQERESVRELHIELQSRMGPAEIEKQANELEMVPAESAIQIQVRREHLNSGHQLEPVLTRSRVTSDWLSVDRLLTEALASAASTSSR